MGAAWITPIDTSAADPQGQANHQAQRLAIAGVRQHHQAAIQHQAIGAEANGLRQVAAQLQLACTGLRLGSHGPTAGRQVACQRRLPTSRG